MTTVLTLPIQPSNNYKHGKSAAQPQVTAFEDIVNIVHTDIQCIITALINTTSEQRQCNVRTQNVTILKGSGTKAFSKPRV